MRRLLPVAIVLFAALNASAKIVALDTVVIPVSFVQYTLPSPAPADAEYAPFVRCW